MHFNSTPDLTSRQDVLDIPGASGVGSPLAASARACLRHILDENDEISQAKVPTVTTYPGAGLVEMHKPGDSEAARGVRGVVKGFSSASRLRLLKWLARVRLDALLPLFLGLTYPDNAPLDCHKYKRDIKVFIQRLVYEFPDVCGFWRLEFVPRLSGTLLGELVGHFHLVLWGITLPRGRDEKKAFYARIRRIWWEVVGSGDPDHLEAGTRLEPIRSRRGVFFYVSKYIGKVDESALAMRYTEGLGRVWGTIQAEKLPVVEGVTIPLSDIEAVKLQRLIRGYIGGRRRFTCRFAFTEGQFWLEKVVPWLKGVSAPSGYKEFCEYADHISRGDVLKRDGLWYSVRFIPATDEAKGYILDLSMVRKIEDIPIRWRENVRRGRRKP